MFQPLVYIDTSEVREGVLDELKGAIEELVAFIDANEPKPFRRRSRGTFAAAIHEQLEVPEDILKTNYPLLVRALANIVLCFVPDRGVWFTTMERGHYGVEATNGSSSLAEGVVERLIPLAESKLVIENEFRTDLEEELWEGDEITETIREAGVRMGDLDLLPLTRVQALRGAVHAVLADGEEPLHVAVVLLPQVVVAPLGGQHVHGRRHVERVEGPGHLQRDDPGLRRWVRRESG